MYLDCKFHIVLYRFNLYLVWYEFYISFFLFLSFFVNHVSGPYSDLTKVVSPRKLVGVKRFSVTSVKILAIDSMGISIVTVCIHVKSAVSEWILEKFICNGCHETASDLILRDVGQFGLLLCIVMKVWATLFLFTDFNES